MKQFLLSLLFFCILFSDAMDQKLPEEDKICNDVRRLDRDGSVEGLNDDQIINRIDLQFDHSNDVSLLIQNSTSIKIMIRSLLS